METKAVETPKQWIKSLRSELTTNQTEAMLALPMNEFGNKAISFRLEAVEELGTELIKREIDLELLSRMAVWDPDWRVREAVIKKVADIGDAKAIDILTNSVNTDADGDVRLCAMRCLKKLETTTNRISFEPEHTASVKKEVDPKLRSALERIRDWDWSRRVREEAENTLAELTKTPK